MHPEIKKFWEKSGKEIHAYNFSTVSIWFIYSNPSYYDQGGPPPPFKEDVVCIISGFGKQYFLLGSSYDQDQMLRIVRLKAFI
jgi:hypothetical protein